MGMRIGLLGLCDAGGVSTSLKQFLPKATIVASEAHRGEEELKKVIDELNNDVDVVLVNSIALRRYPTVVERLTVDILPYPQLIFNAFHPDCVYVLKKDDNVLISPGYNSALALACYVRGLSISEAVSYFNSNVFSRLGYFDRWQENVDSMKLDFESYDFDFRKFFFRVKRHGVFMHSINHPAIVTLVTLARLIAIKLGASEDVMDQPVIVPDALANFGWPLYPEIGQIYSAPGSYMWLHEGKYLDLEAYVTMAYHRYDELRLTKENTAFGTPEFNLKLGLVF